MLISDWSSDVCSSDLHLALHPLVDDEGASRDARRILDEGADIGIADIQRLLSRHWRSEDKREGGRYFEEMSGHWPCQVRPIGPTAAPRSTIRQIRATGPSQICRSCRYTADRISRPFTRVRIAPH